MEGTRPEENINGQENERKTAEPTITHLAIRSWEAKQSFEFQVNRNTLNAVCDARTRSEVSRNINGHFLHLKVQ